MKTVLTLLCLLVLALLLAACGGGSADAPDEVQQGTGDLPGTVGDISSQPAPGDFPVAQPITGGSEDAPLGMDTQYNMTPIGAELGSFGEVTEVKGSSAVVIPPSGFDVLDVTIVGNGEDPDWNLSSASFNEGEPIDLWVKFNVYGGQSQDLVRRWVSPEINLSLAEAEQTYDTQGEYAVKLDYAIPYVGAKNGCQLTVDISSDGALKSSDPFSYDIIAVPNTTVSYPTTPAADSCMPASITVVYDLLNLTASVVSDKDISNVVLRFEDGSTQKFDNLSGHTGTFAGTGLSLGKRIQGTWVKSGCNYGTDGPGYGEWVSNDGQRNWAYGFAQMSWEDLLTTADYDYNDFVSRIKITETRDAQNNLVQIDMVIKAVARSAGYDSDFQFNMNGAFAGQNITSIVDQYYAGQTNPDGSPKRHGNQRAWRSSGGVSLPIFTPIRNALPNPPGSYATNGVPGTEFVDGDYAVVKVVFEDPVPAGTYTPMPYRPELRVQASGGSVYILGLWQQKGDWLDSNGRPLAFIVADSFAWPLEGKRIWDSYPVYTDWVKWINNELPTAPNPAFWDKAAVKDAFFRSLFL
jgi:hypothetical protein